MTTITGDGHEEADHREDVDDVEDRVDATPPAATQHHAVEGRLADVMGPTEQAVRLRDLVPVAEGSPMAVPTGSAIRGRRRRERASG